VSADAVLDSDALLDLLPYGVLVAGPDGRAVSANRAWPVVTGQAGDGWRGTGWLDLAGRAAQAALLADARDGVVHDADWAVLAEERGTERVLHVHAVPTCEDGRLTSVVVVASDVTQERAASERLLHLATRDSLTGLLNRAQLLEAVRHALSRRPHGDGSTAVLFVDVDDLKGTNDRLGHAAGDRVLVAIAHGITSAMRPADLAGRYGGDEFAVLCEGIAAAAEAASIGARVQTAAAVASGSSVSIGVAIAGDGEADPAALLAAADRAMYRAKATRSGPDGAPPVVLHLVPRDGPPPGP
jgi:diguanylate cyclase (GGDEF)-like protein/PAS domain S-box-containing protein